MKEKYYVVILKYNGIAHIFSKKEEAEEYKKNVDDNAYIKEIDDTNLFQFMLRNKNKYLFSLQRI